MSLSRLFRVFLLLTFLSSFAAPVYGQEDLVKKQAAELFDKGDYPAAFPLYSQLLSNYPKDPNYNYRFGVCMLYGNADKAKSLSYLEFASKDPSTEKDVWFYLGRAYHLNYRFDDAINAYSKYRQLAGEKKAEKLQVNNQIAMCRTGKKLLRAITDIEVLEKKELSRNDFFRSYDLSGYSGQLLVKPDEFKTALDKKKNETSVIYLSGEKNELYYSSYGENEDNGKDIYVVRKLPNGTWSKPQSVGYPINTEYDEDYPFLHPNGKVLYFSSKGHSSMGGYDIFRSELNEETNTWLKPVNLDFAINTPDDDILYITDFEEKSAYFASARNSPDGQMTVYHVSIERKPVEYCLIKGNVMAMDDQPSRSARIIIKNLETDEIVGIFKSNEQTGDYLLNLPNGGKFEFTVEKNGKETQSELVLVPPQYQIKPVRQELGYKEMNGREELYVITYFDDDTAGLSPDFLRDKAKLDVTPREVVDMGNPPDGGNPDGPGTAGTNSTTGPDGQNPATATPPTTAAVSNTELVKIAYTDAAEVKTEAKEKRAEADRAIGYAAELNRQTQEKQQEADAARAAGNTTEATTLQAEADALRVQTIAAFTQAEAIGRDAQVKTQEADLSQQYATRLDQAVKSKKPGAIEQLGKEQEQLELLSETRPDAEATLTNLQSNAAAKRTEAEKAEQQAADLKSEIADQQAQADKLRADAKKEKDKDLRQGMEEQAGGIDEDIALNKEDLQKAETKAARLRNESNLADLQLAGANQTVNQAQNTSYVPEAVDATQREQLQTAVRGYEKQVGEMAVTTTVPPVATTTTATTSTTPPNTTTTTTTTPPTTTSIGSTEMAVLSAPYAAQEKNVLAIADAATRERRKAELYDAWAGALDSALTAKQEQRKTASAAEKKKLGNEITALQAELDKRQEQATTAITRAQELEAATTVTAQTPPDTEVTTTTPPDTQLPDDTLSSPTVSEALTLQEQYAAALANADTTTDPVQREQQKAAAARSHTAALKEEVAAKQQALKTTPDKTAKAALQAEIKELNAQVATTEQQAKTFDAQVAKAETIAAASTPVNSTFAPQLQAASAQQDPQERATAETQVYTEWAEALETAAAAKDKEAATLRKKDQQELARAQAADLRNQAEAKRTLAETAAAATTPVATTTPAQPATTTTEPQFTTPAAQQQLAARTTTLRTADAQRAERDSLNTAAAAATGPEKDRLLRAATAVQRDLWATEARAADQLGQANAQQFAANNTQLAALKTAAAESPTSKTESAALLADEAARLFDQAATERKAAAAASNDPYTRDENLRAAETHEQQALTKQQEAAARYTEAGVQPVAITPILPENSAASNTVEGQLGQPFVGQLKAAEALPNVAARERRKSEIYDQWADVLDSAITAKQEQLAQTTSAAEKKTLREDIAALQAELDKRGQQAADAITKAQTAEQANPVTTTTTTPETTTTTPVTSPPPTNEIAAQLDRPFESQLQAAEALPTLAARERRKSEIYDQWADALDSAIADKLAQVEQTSNAAKKKTLREEIVALQAELDKRGQQAAEAITKAQTAEQANPETATTTPPETTTTTLPEDQGDPQIVGVVVNPATGQPFKADELEVVRNSEAYRNYAELAKEADETEVEAASQRRQAAKYDAAADAHIAEAQRLTDLASDENDAAKRQRYFDLATQENQLARKEMAKRDSMLELNENTAASSRSKRNEAELFLQEVDKTSYEQVKAVTQAERIGSPVLPSTTSTAGTTPPATTTPTTTTPVTTTPTTTTPTTTTSTTPPATTTPITAGESFRLNPSIRTATSAIPINPPLPEGLVFKVQVGAFRNPLPPNTFNGISPLTGETTPQGLTRYMAGLFLKFNTANVAKQQIRSLGYSDAFVVAFYNGKRISLAEALRLSGESVSAEVLANADAGSGQPLAAQPGRNTTPGGTYPQAGGNTPGTNTTPQPGSSSPSTSASATPAPTRDVAAVSGLFYTVQVGVFSQAVSADRLYNLPGLNSERLPNGNLRYSAGSYANLNGAVQAKNGIVNTGISDAFVTAYYNGKRISIAEAKLLEQQGVAPATLPASTLPTPPTTTTERSTTPVAAALPFSKPVDGAAPVADTGLVFTVQLGAFREQVPVAVANNFLQFAGRGVRHYVDPNTGFTVFMTAPVAALEDASVIRDEAVAKGIPDAFMIAWLNGKKIPMSQARAMQGK